MAAPTVSAIIPAYNYARVLPQAIESVLRQTVSPLEVLVIDDGSTDDTASVVAARFGTNPLVRYIHQPNAGLSSARNTGIQNARGEFVGFLDADDAWKPQFLEKILAHFSRLPPEFAMVTCRSQLVTLAGDPLTRKQIFPYIDREFTCADILLKTRFAPSSVVIRRHTFDALGMFDTSLRSSEDRDMWVRVAAAHRVYYHGSEALIQVSRHAFSMSTHTDRMRTNTARTLEKARQNPQLQHLSGRFWRKVQAFFRFETAWMYFEEGRRGEALKDLGASIRLWPWFCDPTDVNEPSLFRLRTLRHFLLAKNPRPKKN